MGLTVEKLQSQSPDSDCWQGRNGLRRWEYHATFIFWDSELAHILDA